MSAAECDRLVDDILNCRKCQSLLARKLVDPFSASVQVEARPIVPPFRSQPILLIGQAPGITEYERCKPFQGQAGQGIRKILSAVGVGDFDRMVYSTAVVKCFPGRKIDRGRSADDLPSIEMIQNCLPFLDKQRQFIAPQIIVTLGGLALKSYLRLRLRKTADGALEKFVGHTEKWGTADVIFFPHTSGSSRWLNSLENKRRCQTAIDLLREALLERNLVQ